MEQFFKAFELIGINKADIKALDTISVENFNFPISRDINAINNQFQDIDLLINFLTSTANDNWGDIVDEINCNNLKVDILYKTIMFCSKNSFSPPNFLKLITLFIEYNNILFFSNASYIKYQEVSTIGLKLLDEVMVDFDVYWKCRFYLDSVYSDLIYSKEFSISYPKRILQSYHFMNIKGNINDRFLSLIHISQYNLFNGRLKRGLHYLESAELLLPKVSNTNYKAFYIYHRAWMLIENGSYKLAEKKLLQFLRLEKRNKVSIGISLNCKNILASLLARIGKFKKAELIAKSILKQVDRVFAETNNSIKAETYITLARCDMFKKNYFSAEKRLIKAIKILEKAFGGESIDPSQAIATFILAKSYSLQGAIDKAFDNYQRSIKMYLSFYNADLKELNEFRLHIDEAINLAVTHNKAELAKKYRELI